MSSIFRVDTLLHQDWSYGWSCISLVLLAQVASKNNNHVVYMRTAERARIFEICNVGSLITYEFNRLDLNN